MSASALAQAWPASVSFFPAALALAKARSPIKAAHHCRVALSSGVGAGVRGCWRRGRVGAVVGWAVLEGGGPSTTWAQMSRTWFLRIPEPPSKISVIQDLEQTRPALYSKFSFEVSKKPTRPSSLFPGRARR